eukprot:TRINITY_DN6173_c0_g1_i1.p3 TRINITY_DN6173_c0_g1~~TRINITY_DN6173_c0_g1_i1.p3  ORF type:complete len:97 (-),score=12.76 TRINITY_DN6173_c0_g1_i1:283-573(-)
MFQKESPKRRSGYVCSAFTIGLSADLGKTFADDYIKYLPEVFKKKGHFYGQRFLYGCFPGEVDHSSVPEYLTKFEKVLDDNKKKETKRISSCMNLV